MYTLRFFFSSKCSLFHNSNLFVSCIIHILYTGCAKIKKNNSCAKRLSAVHTKLQYFFKTRIKNNIPSSPRSLHWPPFFRLPCSLCNFLPLYACHMPRPFMFLHFTTVIQVKASPLQAWAGPEGYSRLRLPDFVTTAHEGGKVISPKHRPPLPPTKYPRYSFLLEAESNPGP